jgi:hypothetical protein
VLRLPHLNANPGAGPKPLNEQALTTLGEVGEQRRNKDADQEHAYDPKVHALILRLPDVLSATDPIKD